MRAGYREPDIELEDDMTGTAERIAQNVTSWGARLSYGEPQSVGGSEFVPVAFVGFGFGAGEITTREQPEDAGEGGSSGEGGGGGGVSIPLGVYAHEDGRVCFRPNPVTVVMVAAPVITAIGAAIAGIVWASRRRR